MGKKDIQINQVRGQRPTFFCSSCHSSNGFLSGIVQSVRWVDVTAGKDSARWKHWKVNI
jgi:hypothetical protein